MHASVKSIKFLLLIGLAGSLLPAISVKARDKAAPDVSFLDSSLSFTLASRKEKLDFEQTKQLLEAIYNSRHQEMILRPRAKELLELSNANSSKCYDKNIRFARKLLFEYQAFPNINNYLVECIKKQEEVCRNQFS